MSEKPAQAEGVGPPADSEHLKSFTQHPPLNTPAPRHFCIFVFNILPAKYS
jgi:hypothetical protein